MDDREIKQWDKRLGDQVDRGWDNYKHLHIDLSTARIDQSYRMAGEYLYVENASSDEAIAKIRLNRKNNDELDLEDGVKIETVFIEIFISNDALQDEWLDLVFGINFKYKKKIAKKDIAGGLPKTGQTISYQAGDDGFYEAGLDHNYVAQTIGGDDVVIDNATGLMWAGDFNAAGCNNGLSIIWPNALIYAEALNFAGFSDWRLPNIRELGSIVNFERVFPTIEEPPFANTPSNFFWSSTTYFGVTTQAWWNNFGNGDYWYSPKTSVQNMRCVRGGL